MIWSKLEKWHETGKQLIVQDNEWANVILAHSYLKLVGFGSGSQSIYEILPMFSKKQAILLPMSLLKVI